MGYSVEAKWHAEAFALRRVRGILQKDATFDVINIRLSRQNELRFAAPCPVCLARLKKAGCKDIYFSTETGFKSISSDARIRVWCGYNMPLDKFDCQVQNIKGVLALLATKKIAHISIGPEIDDASRKDILNIINNCDERRFFTVNFHGDRATGS